MTSKWALALAICVVGMLYAQPVMSQRIRAYAAVGAVASQIEGDELKGFDKWGFNGGVGAIARLSQNARWWMSVEADYMRRGSRNNSGNPYNINITLDYVDIPLTIHFKDPIGGILIGAGVVYSRLVQQPHSSVAFKEDYFVPDLSDMSFLKNDWSLAAELRFPVWKGLRLSIRYQQSVVAVKKNWQFTEFHRNKPNPDTWTNNCYNQSATIRLLWQF